MIYRDDVKEVGFDLRNELIMTEAEFDELESYCQNELKKKKGAKSFNKEVDDFTSTK